MYRIFLINISTCNSLIQQPDVIFNSCNYVCSRENGNIYTHDAIHTFSCLNRVNIFISRRVLWQYVWCSKGEIFFIATFVFVTWSNADLLAKQATSQCKKKIVVKTCSTGQATKLSLPSQHHHHFISTNYTVWWQTRGIWLVPKSMTLDDLEWPLPNLFHNTVVFAAYNKNLNEDRPILSPSKM